MLTIAPGHGPAILNGVHLPFGVAGPIVSAAISGFDPAQSYVERGGVLLSSGPNGSARALSEEGTAALVEALAALPDYVRQSALLAERQADRNAVNEAAIAAGMSPRLVRALELQLGNAAPDLLKFLTSLKG